MLLELSGEIPSLRQELARQLAPDSTIVVRLMARYSVRLIARVYSQLIPSSEPRGKLCNRLLDALGGSRPHVQDFAATASVLDRHSVAGQAAGPHDPAHVDGEVGIPGKASGTRVQVPEVKPPPVRLLARVLAGKPVEPAFDSTRETEVRSVDRQDESRIEHGCIEPIRYDKFEPERSTLRRRALLPLIDPGEAV